MVEGDLFREVEEDMRREAMKRYWDRFGLYIVGAALLLVAVVAGSQIYNHFRAERIASAGESYLQALDLLEDGKADDAKAALRAIADGSAEGYRQIAQLQLAGILQSEGNTAEAIRLFDAVASTSGGDPLLKDLAIVRSAMLESDTLTLADARSRLESLASAEGAWRHSAREVIGVVAWREGKLAEAEAEFQAIIADAEAPREIKTRAEMMLALIFAKQPAATN